LSGVEIGGGPHVHPEEYTTYLAKGYDFVLVSVHDWYEGLFASEMVKLPMPAEESYALYWDEVYKTVCYGGFDALAHFDFPKRYYGKVMAEKGIAMEINTSSVRQGMEEPMPGKEILDIYKKCGGKYVTIGSDAHIPEDMGADFDKAEKLCTGFTQVYYKARKRNNMK
jgi:histidinol-phosphatase (PHP family)